MAGGRVPESEAGLRRRRAEDAAVALLLLLPFTLFLARALTWTLDWRVAHDTPILVYLAFLMERFGAVPYRDLFDMNMPGTYAVYRGIGRVLGWGDGALRAADLLVLGGLALASGLLLRRFGWRAAWAAALLFPAAYLAGGRELSLQREFLLLLPVAAGLAVAVGGGPLGRRAALGGLGFGLAMTLKPQAGIGLPLLLVYLHGEGRAAGRRGLGWLAWGLAGAALPWACAAAYLATVGAMPAFLALVRGYLPLYGEITGWRIVLPEEQQTAYVLSHLLGLGGRHVWLLLAGVGWGSCWWPRADPALRRQLALVMGLAAAYALYPVASGQFYPYHWLPLVYFLLLGVALCFRAVPETSPAWRRALPWAAAVLALTLLVEPEGRYRRGAAPPKEGRPDAIARFLREHLQPGETVQPVDWAGAGVAHGLLLAEAPLATSFVYHFHFHHHVSTPFIRDLRARFLRELDRAAPRFVVEGRVRRPFVRGRDTSDSFPAFEARLARGYRVAVEAPGYRIWERRPDG